MLRSLRIQNFKGWKDTGTIKLSPITLFFGVNSSGKSSIGQFLMMLKQTAESPDRKVVFYSGGKNSAVQLGSYQQMVFQHDRSENIKFCYKWSLTDELKFKDLISGQIFSGDALRFDAEVGLGDSDQHNIVLHKMNYQLLRDGYKCISIGMKKKIESKSEYKVDSEDYKLIRKLGRVWPPGAPIRFYGFPDEVVAHYQNADFVQELNFSHEKLFQTLTYLGPLRTKAERLYSWMGVEPESVGYAGENAVAAILASRNRKIGLLKPGAFRASPARPFEEIIASKLEQMGLIEKFEVNQISNQRQEYEVKVRSKGSRDWVDLTDVGFGISQVLPVLVQCFYAPANSIILMEQPEIHLHPSAQAALADVMIDVINSKENGEPRNIQLIIETHSEHFLRRLQRRIAEDSVSQEKVSAYFADNAETPTKLESLQIDDYGNIRNWPQNFFGDEMSDITGHARAALEKRKRNRKN